MNLFPLSALTVFLAIAALGFVFLIVTLIFGEIFEFFDHDIDMDHGPGFLSTRVIAVFITAFGAFGAIAMTPPKTNPLAAPTADEMPFE